MENCNQKNKVDIENEEVNQKVQNNLRLSFDFQNQNFDKLPPDSYQNMETNSRRS